VVLGLNGFSLADVSEAWRFHAGGDGSGALQTIGLWESGGNLRTTLRADTLNLIGLAYPAAESPTIPHLEMDVLQPVPSGILAAWDQSPGQPDISVTGVEAILGGSYHEDDSTAGSTDGTFGTTATGAQTATTGFTVRMENDRNSVSLQIVNHSGNPLQLDAVLFDYAPWWLKSPKDVALVYGGGNLAGITTGTVIQSVAGLTNLGSKKGDYYDYDWSLGNLSDHVLDHGEKMILSWRANTGTRYSVSQSTTLQPEDWQPASSEIIGWPGEMKAASGIEAGSSFFRLEIDP
jgi:hypothetical protein